MKGQAPCQEKKEGGNPAAPALGQTSLLPPPPPCGRHPILLALTRLACPAEAKSGWGGSGGEWGRETLTDRRGSGGGAGATAAGAGGSGAGGGRRDGLVGHPRLRALWCWLARDWRAAPALAAATPASIGREGPTSTSLDSGLLFSAFPDWRETPQSHLPIGCVRLPLLLSCPGLVPGKSGLFLAPDQARAPQPSPSSVRFCRPRAHCARGLTLGERARAPPTPSNSSSPRAHSTQSRARRPAAVDDAFVPRLRVPLPPPVTSPRCSTPFSVCLHSDERVLLWPSSTSGCRAAVGGPHLCEKRFGQLAVSWPNLCDPDLRGIKNLS